MTFATSKLHSGVADGNTSVTTSSFLVFRILTSHGINASIK
jgi:hypothetical protein